MVIITNYTLNVFIANSFLQWDLVAVGDYHAVLKSNPESKIVMSVIVSWTGLSYLVKPELQSPLTIESTATITVPYGRASPINLWREIQRSYIPLQYTSTRLPQLCKLKLSIPITDFVYYAFRYLEVVFGFGGRHTIKDNLQTIEIQNVRLTIAELNDVFHIQTKTLSSMITVSGYGKIQYGDTVPQICGDSIPYLLTRVAGTMERILRRELLGIDKTCLYTKDTLISTRIPIDNITSSPIHLLPINFSSISYMP